MRSFSAWCYQETASRSASIGFSESAVRGRCVRVSLYGTSDACIEMFMVVLGVPTEI